MFIKFLPYIGIIVFAVGLFFAGQMRGHYQCELSHEKTQIKEVKVNESINKKIMALPDPDLDKLLNRWMRD